MVINKPITNVLIETSLKKRIAPALVHLSCQRGISFGSSTFEMITGASFNLVRPRSIKLVWV